MSRTIDLRAVLDRPTLGGFRRRVFTYCLLISVVDGFDVQALAFVAPVLTREWGLGRLEMAQLLTAGLVGLLLGNVLLGRLSDRIGRRPVLLYSVVGFGVASLATAFATSPMELLLARLATGVGLGGAIVAALALTAEYAPDRSRATLVTAMFVGFPLGGSVGGLLATPLITTFGWQAVFVAGGVLPLLLIAAIWRQVPESPQYALVSNAAPAEVGALVARLDPDYRFEPGDRFELRESAVKSAGVAELFSPARLPGTLLIWSVCFANLLVLYLLVNWLPSLVHESGRSLRVANLVAVVFNLGGVLGGLALSRMVDRLGAFRVLPFAYAMAAVAVVLLARADAVALVFGLAFVAGAGIIGSQFCVNALASAFYPTAVRSTGVGWALGFGRVGALSGPLIGGAALGAGATTATILSGTAAPILVCSVAVVVLAGAYRRGLAAAPAREA